MTDSDDPAISALQSYIVNRNLTDSVQICYDLDDWLQLNQATVTKPLAQLVRQCTQLNEIRFHTTSLNANCEHMLTTHVTHLVVLDSTNFDTFCFFHRAAALDAVRVLELAYGTLGNDVSAHVKWFANSASLLHVTLRELHLVPPTLLSALVSNTTLTSLYLFGLSSLNDDALRLVLDHRPRQHRRWQLRELQLRNNYALSPSALFALATSLRDLRLDSFAVEILTEPLDRPHTRRLVDIVSRQPALRYLSLNKLAMAPPERIAVLHAVADHLPALQHFALEPSTGERSLDMTEALADAFLYAIDALKRIEVFALAGWRWPESRRATFLRAVQRRHTLHRVVDTVSKDKRFSEFSAEQRSWLEEMLSNHWDGQWSHCFRRLTFACCALAPLDWPAYVTLEVLDQSDQFINVEHSRKIRAIILIKNAFRRKYNKQ